MTDPPQRQLTFRAIATGFVLGALLAPCNIYTGLKIGFSFNMSIAAALLSYAFWNGLHRLGAARHWGMLENNINQTAASSAGSILSAGLVAPIPALTLLTGKSLDYAILALWVFAVSFGGIGCALVIRRQMIDRERLPFPNGVATAETVMEIYKRGREASARVGLLLGAGLISGVMMLVNAFVTRLPVLAPPERWGFRTTGAAAALGVDRVGWRALGLELHPSLLLFGFGAIVGPKVGVSLLLGTLLAWVLLPPELLSLGWVIPASGDTSWYEVMLEWLLWPGVSLMVSGALASFLISIGRIIHQRMRWRAAAGPDEPDAAHMPGGEFYFSGKRLAVILIVGAVLAVVAQRWIFGIAIWLAVVAFLFSFLLAVVAARVSGETGIPPIGALGKVTQMTFGFLSPGNTTVNLMSANVTGGAAGQCSDLLHDLKTGKMIGANLGAQVVAQMFGILSGALAGSAAYLILIPDPKAMLLTPEWPAPAVATWAAVAEVLAVGMAAVPEGCRGAMVIAVAAGVVLAAGEALVPERHRHWVPSASSLGFAFIIPPFISAAIFLGSMIRLVVETFWKDGIGKYVMIVAAGLVAGESLGGVLEALIRFFGISGGV